MFNRLLIILPLLAGLVLAKPIPAQNPTPASEECRNWAREIEQKSYMKQVSQSREAHAQAQGQNLEIPLWSSRTKTYQQEIKQALAHPPADHFCQELAARIRRQNPNNPISAEYSAQALDFMQEEFLEAKRLAALRWKNWQDLFGQVATDSFFRSVFASGRFLASAKNIPAQEMDTIEIVDIRMEKTPTANTQNLLVTSFEKIDDQARDLNIQLLRRVENSAEKNKKILLISSESASALIYRLLDMYPEWRSDPNIYGWLNLDGEMFPSRGPAAELAITALDVPMPLGAGFPVVNLLQKTPQKNYRDAVITDADTVFLPEKLSRAEAIQAGLIRLKQSRPL